MVPVRVGAGYKEVEMTRADRGELEDGDRPKAVVVGPDEGSRSWVAGGFDTTRLTGDQSGGALGVTETQAPRGAGPPLHVHSREDETDDDVEGSFMFFIGDETIAATSGSVVFAPRGIPRTYRIDSPTGRSLCLIVPAGWERFFAAGLPAAEPNFPRRTRRTSTGSGTSRLGAA
jgi:quercetin dioxygenase-like cupin family protein